ncbi:hypothetical protein [Desulfuribacillus alkaliarsenatis]|uniref:Holin n=1 Tax=Desulfuribacillus alkaliarsenatis TaxID=766136 RepID=A0A1E5G6A9_9FIRM|nr:hypothetical protein [Desulfuribacillus alkaliarsenatis]OEF98693.1 hypothetical protein BHF68_03265 [Desulfuribacillus alkaliarsenatis]
MEQLISMEFLDAMSITFIAIVGALVQLSKRYINPYYAPLISIMFGLTLSIGYFFSGLDINENWFIALLRGVLIGLAASGLYSSINMTQKQSKNQTKK